MERTDEDSYEDSRSEEEEEEEEVDEAEEERLKKFAKTSFSGMTFKDYVGEVQKSTNLKKEMKKIMTTFIEQKSTRHHGVHLS